MRFTSVAVTLIVVGAAAFFLIQTEKQIAHSRAAMREFDLHARQATDSLADLRAAQQAYVAVGQGVAFWMPKVAALVSAVTRRVDHLRTLAASARARESLMIAAATVTEFGNVDRRARDYLKAGQPLMAGDVVFTEGGETAAQAARLVEGARLAEHQAFDALEAAGRRRQAYATSTAATIAVLVLVLLVRRVPERSVVSGAGPPEPAISSNPSPEGDLPLTDNGVRPLAVDAPPGVPREAIPALKAAAELCTDFGRVRDADDLEKLLARAADALDASGLIVWLGATTGELRPVLAHGYPAQSLARMPAIPRSADNAAAAAYRSGALQIVLARPGNANGALVAPLLSPDGCIGALTAEIKDRGETSDTVQALAAIFAAQLANVLAAPASSVDAPATVDKVDKIVSA